MMVEILLSLALLLAGAVYLLVREKRASLVLAAENDALRAELDRATHFIFEAERLQLELVAEVEKRHDLSVEFFGMLVTMLAKLPDYRLADREKSHKVNKMKRGITKMIKHDVLEDADIAADPIFQQAMVSLEHIRSWEGDKALPPTQ